MMTSELSARTTPAYLVSAVVTLVVVLLDMAWLALGGWSLSLHGATGTLLAAGVASAILLVPRYRSDVRINAVVRTSVLLIVFSAAAATLSYLVVAGGAPLIDNVLAVADQALGLDWVATHRWMVAHTGWRGLLRVAYHSGLPQIAFVVLFLGFTGRGSRLEGFTGLFMTATLASIAISSIFPAAGPWTHYALGNIVDTSAMSHFEPLRAGALRHIDLGAMQGLISIPSMHTAIAIIVCWAMRSTGAWGWAIVALNALMIVAAPIEGGHYFVDLPAGALLATVLITLPRRRAAAAKNVQRADARHATTRSDPAATP